MVKWRDILPEEEGQDDYTTADMDAAMDRRATYLGTLTQLGEFRVQEGRIELGRPPSFPEQQPAHNNLSNHLQRHRW